jgi:quinoprotein dehydrogenase-associated probable ABC transporter substrate-binding protein
VTRPDGSDERDVTMKPGHWIAPLVVLAALSAAVAPVDRVQAASAEAVDHTALRVCADPNNLPFSNDKGEGFENKIAEVLAAELGVPVRYTWFPDSVGFARNTLRARACDLIVGTTVGAEMLQNTNPYYRSSFSLVYRKEGGLTVASLDDPALQTLQIGVIAGTPPTTLMAQKGLLRNARSYQLLVDTRFDHPARDMVQDIAEGKIDVGILWGPIAGYYAKQQTTPLVVVPLRSEGSPMRLDYRITMGVRPNEPEWKRQVNNLIRKKQPEITRILLDYGVPLIDEQGNPITH